MLNKTTELRACLTQGKHRGAYCVGRSMLDTIAECGVALLTWCGGGIYVGCRRAGPCIMIGS